MIVNASLFSLTDRSDERAVLTAAPWR